MNRLAGNSDDGPKRKIAPEFVAMYARTREQLRDVAKAVAEADKIGHDVKDVTVLSGFSPEMLKALRRFNAGEIDNDELVDAYVTDRKSRGGN